MSVGYKFSSTIPDSLGTSRPCFSSYASMYNPKQDYYVNVTTFDLIDKFLEFLKNNVKNFIIERVTLRNGKTCFKVTVSKEYNPLSRKIITYMCGVFINQFSRVEEFIDDENPDVCDWNFLAKINNARRNNTNHIIYSPYTEDKILKAKWLEVLDDVDFCNNVAFKESFESVEGRAGLCRSYNVDSYIPQTAIINRIKLCLEGGKLEFKPEYDW